MPFLTSFSPTTGWPTADYIILALAIGYLMGAIPFGLLITRLAGHEDIRKMGSGNIGATNVLRTGSKKLAALTLLADILKGLLPVLFIQWYTGEEILGYYAGLGAFLGHLYPVWLAFKGGKGVATFIGALLGFNLWLGLIFILVWMLTAYFFRISSLAALGATFTILLISAGYFSATFFILFMAILLFWRHRDNISRLLKGEESRIGES